MPITKREVLDDPESAFNKAADDEPIFVVRAQDIIGAGLVRNWATNARRSASSKKCRDAKEVADAMERWPNRKDPD